LELLTGLPLYTD